MHTLHFRLGGSSFDILERSQTPNALKKVSRLNLRGDDNDFVLVQLNGATDHSVIDELAQKGYELVQYIAPFGHVLWGPALSTDQDQQELTGIGSIRSAVHFSSEFKTVNIESDETTEMRSAAPQSFHMLVLRNAGLDLNGLDAAFDNISFSKSYPLDSKWDLVEFEASASDARGLADVPGVFSVQQIPTTGGTRAEETAVISHAEHATSDTIKPGHLAFLEKAGVTGHGAVVAIVDEGPIDAAHKDLKDHTSSSGNPSNASRHATHVAGIVSSSSNEKDESGFAKGGGLAPGAKLLSIGYSGQSISELIKKAQKGGAHISQNSWGPSGSPRGYDIDTKSVDVGVRDADPLKAGNQAIAYVLSIMNGEGGTSTQGSPDEAKNAIVVGSTGVKDGTGSPPYNSVSDNSAHGPALDGRTQLPLLLTPGCSVLSTLPNNTYGRLCGTSMASPVISGSVSLFIEKYHQLSQGKNPSPALMKAAVVSACMDLVGGNDADGAPLTRGPNPKQGWGRLNLTELLMPTVDTLLIDQNQESTFSESGQLRTFECEVIDATKPVKAILAYTDAPGHGLGGDTPAWNNDLDLIVTHQEQTYLGNRFGAEGWSTEGGDSDPMHNVEVVRFAPGTNGKLKITIRATNINSDGVPGNEDETDQDFSLVLKNLKLIDSSHAGAIVQSKATSSETAQA